MDVVLLEAEVRRRLAINAAGYGSAEAAEADAAAVLKMLGLAVAAPEQPVVDVVVPAVASEDVQVGA